LVSSIQHTRFVRYLGCLSANWKSDEVTVTQRQIHRHNITRATMVRFLTGLALSAIAGLTGVNAIPTISVKGSKFFTSEGNQFYVKGKFWLHGNACNGC
jgi:hypothetical protein